MKRLFVSLLLAAACAAPAQAQRYPDGRAALGGPYGQDEARAAVRAGRQISFGQVIAAISARTPGRHLNMTQGEHRGRPAYFVQWQMPDGAVVVFIVDAESGAILGQSR